MLKHVVPMFLAAIMIAPSHAQQPVPTLKAVPIKSTPVTSGKIMFDNYCATCHGATGVGNGSAAPALKIAPANLTKLSAGNQGVFPGDRVAAVLRFGPANPAHGSAEMPIWGDLFSTMGADGRDQAKLRIRNLTDYLKTLQK